MKLFGFELRRADPALDEKANQFEGVLDRIVAGLAGGLGKVTPDNCLRSPTVHAIDLAVSRRMSVTPVAVYQKGQSNGRETKEKLADHPVTRLLQKPNAWQTRAEFWLDCSSTFLRWGRFFAYKSRGSTGPIRELLPLHPSTVVIDQHPKTWKLTYKVTTSAGQDEFGAEKLLHVRARARDFVNGDSPVQLVANSIALEIAAEEFGSTFFNNGALPLMMMKYAESMKPFKTAEAERKFVEDFQRAFSGSNRHRAMLLPKGIEAGNPISIENDKAQMIESRRYQRTVIAGAFGVPPHLVGDLERATFNNVEQQDLDFTSNVVQPVATAFEVALERDLLTDDDRAQGRVIRFNLDSILRSDFKSRQEGTRIQREMGVVSVNEVREREGLNPIPADKGGDDYIRPANMVVAGEPVPPKGTPQGSRNAEDSRPA